MRLFLHSNQLKTNIMRILKATLFFGGFLLFFGGLVLFLQTIWNIDSFDVFKDLEEQQRFIWFLESRYYTVGLILIVGTLLIGFFQDWYKEPKN